MPKIGDYLDIWSLKNLNHLSLQDLFSDHAQWCESYGKFAFKD